MILHSKTRWVLAMFVVLLMNKYGFWQIAHRQLNEHPPVMTTCALDGAMHAFQQPGE